jgi:hypothetical protein
MSEDSGKEPVPIAAVQPDAAASPGDQEMTATVAYPAAGAEPQSTAAAPGGDEGTLSGGTLLKHFRIVRLVGRGGMGDIYEAHDESLERTVAIKVIRAARNLARDDHAHLVHEARAQARINHPHVVQIYYVGLEPECPFLAMEFVRGTTLAERIRQSPLAFRDIVRISMQIILPRGMAWFFDLALLAIVMAVIGVLQLALARIPLGLSQAAMSRISGITVNLVAAAVFAVLVLAHARVRTTPGKWLFQISIADQHGLPAPSLRLIPRLLLSQFPISLSLVFNFVSGLIGADWIWLSLTQLGLSALFLAANVASLLIDKRRLALHDRLLGTRAVINHAT